MANPPSTALNDFQNPIVDKLYDADIVPDPQLVEQILALPRASLIQDLEQIVQDELEYLRVLNVKNEEYEDSYGLFHALMFLGHLKSNSSLPLILEVWKLDHRLIDLIFGDLLYEDLWQVPLLCGEENLEQLQDFVLEAKDAYVFCRVEIIQAMERMVLKDSRRKQEIIEFLAKALQHYVEISDEEFNDEDDLILVSFLANSLSDFDAREYLPLIESLFKKQRVDVSLRGDWVEFLEDYGKPFDSAYKIYTDVRDWYREKGTEWVAIIRRNDEEAQRRAQKLQIENAQKLREIGSKQAGKKKIGPNEPCPCGSGKKYKKCHGVK